MGMPEVEVLRAACCVAGIDGEVCQREHPLLARIAEAAGVGSASLDAMIDRASSDASFFEDQFDIFKTDPEETMKTLFRIAIADGVLARSERIVLQHFSKKLGMAEDRYESLLNAAEKHARPD
jgi:tellurite resistance protein